MLFALSDSYLLAAATISLVATLAGYFFYSNRFKYFERRGLKNPKPWPLFGNLIESMSKTRLVRERDLLQECGKFYGIFMGARPCFVVADPELLSRICIKDFDAFPNHEAMESFNKHQRRMLVFSQDAKWKRLRVLLSPTFTSGKIKRMYRLLQRCAADLAECFAEQLSLAEEKTGDGKKRDTIVHLKDIYGLYTMDGIASCAYGLKLEREKGTTSVEAAATRNEFVSLALGIFKFRILRMLLILTLPAKLLSYFSLTFTPASVFDPLERKVRAIIQARRNSANKFDDYLQLLLDARLDAKLELNELDARENHHAGLTEASLLGDQKKMKGELKGELKADKAQLSDDDILASAISLLAVGVETTATILTHCTYALAHQPAIQEKLYQEVKSIANANANANATSQQQLEMFDYETLTSCVYLDSVVSETLRSLSPAVQFDRIAKRDYYVEKYNVLIPRGSKVFLAYYAIMNDPDSWHEPHVFNPDRFMPENRHKIVPGSYCPFGIGPRHCLGMRFSLTETKLALATVLMRYKFEPAPGTSFPPLGRRGFGLFSIDTPQVIVKARTELSS